MTIEKPGQSITHSKPVRTFLTLAVIGLTTFTSANAVDPISHTYQGFTAAYRRIEVAVADSGRVKTVNVKRGSKVREGQLLYELETDVLSASLAGARSRANAKARIEALKVEQQIKERRYAGVSDLANSRAATPDELNRAEGELRVARLNVEAALEKQAEAAHDVKEIEARIEARRSRSPVNGIVTDVRHEVGEFVSTSDPHVATVVDLSQLRVTFYLPTEDALQLQAKMNVGVSIIPINKRVQGIIEYVAPVTEAESGRVRTDVLIENSRTQLRAGLLCALDASSIRMQKASAETRRARTASEKRTNKTERTR